MVQLGPNHVVGDFDRVDATVTCERPWTVGHQIVVKVPVTVLWFHNVPQTERTPPTQVLHVEGFNVVCFNVVCFNFLSGNRVRDAPARQLMSENELNRFIPTPSPPVHLSHTYRLIIVLKKLLILAVTRETSLEHKDMVIDQRGTFLLINRQTLEPTVMGNLHYFQLSLFFKPGPILV